MRDALDGFGSMLVLGGTSEIGLAIVRRLADARTRRIVLAGRPSAALDAAAAALPAATTEAFDARDTESVPAVLGRVWAGGDVDLVIAAAGVLGDDAVTRADPGAAVALWRVNFTGLGAAILEAAARLRDQGHGTLVVLSSVAGERARAANFVYGASKAGLDALAQGLGDALHGTGVRVLVVRPGYVHTRMTRGIPAPPLSTTPDAVADRVAAALGRGSHTVWAPPAMRWVMSAVRHLPRPVFRRLPL